jgi:hypothetical protein
VKWALSKDPNEEKNSTFNKISEEFVDGKSKYLINITDIIDNNSIYLNVFYKSNNSTDKNNNSTDKNNNSTDKNNNSTEKINSKLAYYVFKYIRGNDARNLFDVKLKNRNVSISKKDKTYTLQFEPALENKTEEEDVTYYVKGIYKDSFVKGEKLESIAISESPSINLKVHNVSNSSSGKIELKLENVEKDLSYIKVLAKATSRAINEHMLYEVVDFNKIDNKGQEKSSTDKKPSKGGSNTLAIVLISVGGGLVLIISLILIFVCCCKNKEDLAEKVNTISFTEQRDTDDDLLASD